MLSRNQLAHVATGYHIRRSKHKPFPMISESPSYCTPWSRQISGRKVFQAERTERDASEVCDDMTHSGERWELGLNKQAAGRSQNVVGAKLRSFKSSLAATRSPCRLLSRSLMSSALHVNKISLAVGGRGPLERAGRDAGRQF